MCSQNMLIRRFWLHLSSSSCLHYSKSTVAVASLIVSLVGFYKNGVYFEAYANELINKEI